MVRLVGQKKAREMWFLARLYDARQALAMGLVNAVVPLEQLEAETLAWWVGGWVGGSCGRIPRGGRSAGGAAVEGGWLDARPACLLPRAAAPLPPPLP